MKLIYIFTPLLFAACAGPYHHLAPREFSELRYPYPVKKVQLQHDIEMAYFDEGSGDEAIIFVHGLGSYAPAWWRNVAGLRRHFRCLAVDLPGYGKSSKGVYPISMSFYAKILVEFMDRLGLEKATIAGHSMGGQIAMVTALKYPQRVSRLVLVAPAGFETFTEGEKQWFREVMTVDFVKATPVQQIRANVVNTFYNMPDEAEFMVTDRIAVRQAKDFEAYCYTVVRAVHGMVDEPVYDDLERISQPTLIIFGANDNLIPNPILHGGRTRDVARIGDEKIPHSRLVTIPRCGHFAQFEKPDVVNQAIVEFLQK